MEFADEEDKTVTKLERANSERKNLKLSFVD